MLPLKSANNTWPLPYKYQFKKEIGRGSSAHVCKALDKEKKSIVAIKRYGHIAYDQNCAKNCLREIEILRKTNHKNLVHLYDVFPCPTQFGMSICLSLECFPMSVWELIQSNTILQQIQLKKMIYDLIVGLNYLHSAGIVHRDIKPGNVLLNQQCEVKICDFDLARSLNEKNDSLIIHKKNEPPEKEEPFRDEEIPNELGENEEINKKIEMHGKFSVEIGKVRKKRKSKILS